MNNPGAAQVAWAKQLLAAEGTSGDRAEECTAAAWRVYERLNARLSPLLGSAGSQSLLVRSAKLAQAEFACLVEVAAPEGLTKLGTCLQSLEPAIATEAPATLFGTLHRSHHHLHRRTVDGPGAAQCLAGDRRNGAHGDKDMRDRAPIRKLPSGRADGIESGTSWNVWGRPSRTPSTTTTPSPVSHAWWCGTSRTSASWTSSTVTGSCGE